MIVRRSAAPDSCQGTRFAVMLHFREENNIACAHKFVAPGLRHEIDALADSARENDLVRRPRAEIMRHLARASRRLRSRASSARADRDARCAFVFVKATERVDHLPRFLRGRGVVKIDQGISVNLLLQDRKVMADGSPIGDWPCMGRDFGNRSICARETQAFRAWRNPAEFPGSPKDGGVADGGAVSSAVADELMRPSTAKGSTRYLTSFSSRKPLIFGSAAKTGNENGTCRPC